jgi:hypothetical protein
MQPGERQQPLRYEARILSYALRKRFLVYAVEYDPPASADLEHTPDPRNRKRHRLYCRVDRRLAECRGFSRRGAIELHDARAPLEYLGHIPRREQFAVAQAIQRRDPGLEAAENLGECRLNRRITISSQMHPTRTSNMGRAARKLPIERS